MLYVTTRNITDTFTANNTLVSDYARDEGLYVPFKIPVFSPEEIDALKEKSFGQCVADILNLCFSARLDAWDVDFCIGKSPVKLVSMSHKLIIAQTWHNTDWKFSSFVRTLINRIRGTEGMTGEPSNWAKIAVRIAFLFGLFSELLRSDLINAHRKFDVAVSCGDFIAPMAVFYARQMGLPIGTVVCGCVENEALWELIRQGQLRMEKNKMNVPQDLERLIFLQFGPEEANRFADTRCSGGIYALNELQQTELSNGIYAAVISNKRTNSVIRNVYNTNSHILHPQAAVAFGGLQDFRNGAGEMRPALLLSESGPVCAAETVADALEISVQQLKQLLRSV